MRAHLVLAQSFTQVEREALAHAALVHEDQGGAVLLDQLDQALIDLAPDLVRHHRAQRALR